MNRKKIAYLAGLVTVTLGLSLNHASARELTGVTVEWAPHYGSVMPDGGAMTQITKAAFQRTGHSAEISFIAWNRALKNVEEGKDDFVMGAYSNEERARTYFVSEPVYYLDFGLVALDSLGFAEMDGLRSIEPYTIGVNLGYANTEEFDAADYLAKEVAPSPKLNIRKLYRDRIDMVIGAFDVVRFEARKENMNTSRLVFIQPPLQRNALYLLVSRNIPDGEQIVNDFNAGLAQITADGTLDDLLRNYLGRNN
jgi:polar amino acid transport system substrate-binding protein